MTVALIQLFFLLSSEQALNILRTSPPIFLQTTGPLISRFGVVLDERGQADFTAWSLRCGAAGAECGIAVGVETTAAAGRANAEDLPTFLDSFWHLGGGHGFPAGNIMVQTCF